MTNARSRRILNPTLSAGASLTCPLPGQIRLEIPAGPAGRYRVAQLDDYRGMPRHEFRWQAPLELSLVARASARYLPGTWGFGFWNDPFSLIFPAEARALRLPTLPNTAWFFFSSPENYLSLRDDLPASGPIAAVFRSVPWPSILTMLAVPIAPLLFIRPLTRLIRRLGRQLVNERSCALPVAPNQYHQYRIQWETSQIDFWIDHELIFTTNIVPRGAVGLIIWVDNQYAASSPNGQLKYGTLANTEPAWIEIEDLQINNYSLTINEP